VFCATDLQSAEQVYLSKSFVYGYRFGVGTPADLPLHDVVQASACLPGAFPPRWLRARRFGFHYPDDAVHPEDPCPNRKHRPPASPTFLVLTDGGAYDNIADQWAIGRRSRTACFPDPDDLHREPQELIVVNASAGAEWVPFRRSWIPGIGELLSLLKVKDVLYDETTATRRRLLNDRARQAAQTGQGMQIGLVNIPRSSFGLPKEFERFQDAAGQRARVVLAALGETEKPMAAGHERECDAGKHIAVQDGCGGLRSSAAPRLCARDGQPPRHPRLPAPLGPRAQALRQPGELRRSPMRWRPTADGPGTATASTSPGPWRLTVFRRLSCTPEARYPTMHDSSGL
jgi:hypothetical protein